MTAFRLLSCAVMLVLAAAPAAIAQEKRKPNIVLVLADDLGWADLGCYGNRFNETPNIDRLAKQGLRFTDFYAAAPVCSPTRASILTGLYPARLGLTAHIPGHWRPFEKLAEPPNAQALPRSAGTVAAQLKAAGYATALFGKWHLGGKGSGPSAFGFDAVFEFMGHTVPGPRQDPPVAAPRRTADYLADLAIRFMEQNKGKPFFLEICHFAVHIPLDTTPELRAKYEAKPKVPDYSCHPLYAGLLEEMDRSVGRVLEALERLGLAEDTIVIFTSDNGGLEREVGGWPGTCNRPLRKEKGTLYEGGVRVPLIVRWPGKVAPGPVCHEPAISTDFAPTFRDVAGITARADAPCDGVSLRPLWRDPAGHLKRGALFWHYPHYHHDRPCGAVRAGDWKAIEFFDDGSVELYNLKDDLGEQKDLAKQMPARARELQSMLARWRLSLNAQMPQANPAYDPRRAGEWWSRATLQRVDAPGTYKAPAKK